MIIANPIYDIVFKYLMEDTDIAKGMLSMIMNVEITELSVKPQETITETMIANRATNVYRLDFVAVIKEENGNYKKVLIELQKTKRSTNILRFRRYLGENYQKEDKVIVNGKEISQSLEIITVYFLGFELEDVPASVLKVKNCFIDVTTGQTLVLEPRDKFIRLLNHESYTVQIPKLNPNTQSRVENVLDVFNQRYRTDDDQKLDYKINSNDPLIKQITDRLTRAIADEDLRRKMNIEDEIERGYNMELQEMEIKLEAKLEAMLELRFEEEEAKMEAKFEAKEAKMEAKFEEKEAKLKAKLEEKEAKMEEKEAKYKEEIEELKRQLAKKNK